jgi:hypothetical protein
MKPISAPTTLTTAPKAVAQPQRTRVTFRLTELEAEKCRLGARWRAAMERRLKFNVRMVQARFILNEAIAVLLAKAAAEQWSQRQLAARIGIPETTFRRIRDQQVDAMVWLPKVSAALARINI